LLEQLAVIEFDGEISFSRYNEPLANKEIILDRISLARDILPNSILRINTNGDYVDRTYLLELRDVGLSELWIQQYLKNNDKFNHKKAELFIDKKIKKLGFNSRELTNKYNYKIEHEILIDGITCNVRARNFALNGSNRGGVVDIKTDYIRTKPCRQVYNNMYIDYNGKAMVCCAVRSDYDEHKNMIVGDVYKNSLEEIFMSEVYKKWREEHSGVSEKTGICKSCKIGVV